MEIMTDRLGLHIDPADRRAIEAVAEREGRTLSNAARRVLRAGLAALEEENRKHD